MLKVLNTQGVVQLTVQHWAFVRNPCRILLVIGDKAFQEVTATFWLMSTKTVYIRLVFVDRPKHNH